ncbi:MAG: hypothetical protein Q8M83_04565 [bacterium]|nr:hypothetical protein [bacterium]
MDEGIIKFFNCFHQILGVDIEANRREALIKVEELMAERCLARLLQELKPKEQEAFKNFTNRAPTPSKKEVVDFLRSQYPLIDWSAVFSQEIQEIVKSYVNIMTKNADDEQKKKIQEAFAELAENYQGEK